MKIYGVKPEIEAFDLNHILEAAEVHAAGDIVETPYFQFVTGARNAMPAD